MIEKPLKISKNLLTDRGEYIIINYDKIKRRSAK